VIRRLIIALVGLVAASTLLAGCGQLPAPDRTPVIDGVAADLLPFYGQQLDWQPCDGADEGADYCTRVTAPLDWAAPAAGEIDLAVIVRVGDSGQSTASLLTNPGGPGASGYSLIADSAVYAVGEELASAFDVVGFDPRGVGRSTAVRCFDAPEMDAYLFDVPAAERGSPEWEAELTAMRERMKRLRVKLADAIRERSNSADFDFIARHSGMFSLLGLPEDVVKKLKLDDAIYMINDSRINVAGIPEDRIGELADKLLEAVREPVAQ